MSISAWHVILLKTQKLLLYQLEKDRIDSVATTNYRILTTSHTGII